MADKKKIYHKNIEGNFFVDTTCIDCGTCYWMAPNTFKDGGEQSYVHHQPTSESEQKISYRALLSCPTFSIGVREKPNWINEIAQSFPYIIDKNVYHCGYHSESSYGAASYLILDPRGNILVDSPRYIPLLAKSIEKLGGIKYQYLTHKDDIADTDKFHEHFKSERIIHLDDTNSKTRNYEIILEGENSFQLTDDSIIITVPGHTKGHTVLLYDQHFLFTGDHLAFSDQLNHLYAFKNACWYDFQTQIQSMEKLLQFKFCHVLPGHGAPLKCNFDQMVQQLQLCINWMKT
ncbi:MAG: MBL fold metallo-hydrolase [Bacteriovoracaceae bacterium]